MFIDNAVEQEIVAKYNKSRFFSIATAKVPILFISLNH